MRPSRLLTRALPALLGLFLVAGCGDMPEDDPGALDRVTLVAMLEPGASGIQDVLLNRPLPLDSPVNDTTAFLGGAEIRLRRVPGGEEILLVEDAARYRYSFDRALFPLAPGDSVELGVAGSWNGRVFAGAAATRIVSAAGLDFTGKPQDRSHGYDADTLMVFDPATEDNFNNPSAFYVDWEQACDDGCDYQYQLEFRAVVRDTLSGLWVSTPRQRLHWLRDDEELAWQVGPYPDLRLPPGRRVAAQPVSWGFFVFVDEEDTHAGDPPPGRRLGYYEVTLRRLNGPLAAFFYSTHWWFREMGFDPVEFNLEAEHLQGVVGSCARTSFRIVIVDDTVRE